MKKCILVIGMMIVAGCASEVTRWESAGTLISVSPAEELTRSPGRLGSAIGETGVGRTRVETTGGAYIVHGKVGVVQTGMPVKVGYHSSGEYRGMPSHLAIGNRQYEIAR
jgi:hypothetical protein